MPPAGRETLLLREPIKGPENGSIARFLGLCCYQNGSEKRAFGAWAAGKNRFAATSERLPEAACEPQTGLAPRRGSETRRKRPSCTQGLPASAAKAAPVFMLCAPASSPKCRALHCPNKNAASAWQLGRFLDWFALSFREQIKGPENGSIARFDGLCCYQIGSEIRRCLRAVSWNRCGA